MHRSSPLLGVDVWEHSYYVDLSRRGVPKYFSRVLIERWFNWGRVEEMLPTRTKIAAICAPSPCISRHRRSFVGNVTAISNVLLRRATFFFFVY